MTVPMSCRCCICGRSTVKGGWWNGWTDREYCDRCAKDYYHDDEPFIREDGQMLLEVDYDSKED